MSEDANRHEPPQVVAGAPGVFRFGVMERRTRLVSQYWKLRAAAARPDVYLSCRGLAFMHVSLHADAAFWHLKVRHDRGEEVADVPVPPEFAPGYINAIEIRVPADIVEASAPSRRKITWVAMPPREADRWVRFHIVLEPEGAPDEVVPGSAHGERLLGRVPMSDGRRTCVTANITPALPLPPEWTTRIRDSAEAWKHEHDRGKLRVLTWGYSPETGIWLMVHNPWLA